MNFFEQVSRSLTLASMGAIALAACGGAATGTPTPGSSGSATEALTTICQREADCEGPFFSFTSIADCVRQLGAGIDEAMADPVLTVPVTNWLDRCADDYAKASCAAEAQGASPLCDSWPVGSKPAGAACAVAMECASGECSSAASSAGIVSCGTCVAGTAVGDPCPNGVYCSNGQFCGPSNVCTAALPEGSACTQNTLCAIPSACFNGVCSLSARRGPGATCTLPLGQGYGPSVTGDCDAAQGLVCLGALSGTGLGTCTKATFAPPGASCGASDTDWCQPGSRCQNGLCKVAVAAGGACDPASDFCEDGYFCPGSDAGGSTCQRQPQPPVCK